MSSAQRALPGKFLVGIPSSFMVNQILASNPLPSIEDALKHIQCLPYVIPICSMSREAPDALALVVGFRFHRRGS